MNPNNPNTSRRIKMIEKGPVFALLNLTRYVSWHCRHELGIQSI